MPMQPHRTVEEQALVGHPVFHRGDEVAELGGVDERRVREDDSGRDGRDVEVPCFTLLTHVDDVRRHVHREIALAPPQAFEHRGETPLPPYADHEGEYGRGVLVGQGADGAGDGGGTRDLLLEVNLLLCMLSRLASHNAVMHPFQLLIRVPDHLVHGDQLLPEVLPHERLVRSVAAGHAAGGEPLGVVGPGVEHGQLLSRHFPFGAQTQELGA
mmetsp:Transcript_36776/g.85444  ORF Transcript_36776/g.85444 Transcript_36776/m.85444 type:complete len:213 (-) Transcript_36776:76-714(-)